MEKITVQSLQKQLQALSVLVARSQLLSGVSTQSFGGARDIYQALGYLLNPTYHDYLARYKHQDIAKAVIDRPVKATWRGELALLESDAENETKLEKAFTDLNKRLKLKAIFSRVDRLASLGKYGILFLGLDDVKGVEDYANPVKTGSRTLKYLKPFGEGSAQITEYEAEPTNERYGLPLFYQIQVQSIGAQSTISVKVHYSRVIHIIEDQLENDIEGSPTLEAIFNCLMDIEKITGGDAEMFWRGARPGYDAAVKENFSMTPEIKEALKDQFDEFNHNLTRFLTTEGIDIKALESQVADNPQMHFDIQIQKISAQTGIPKRILTGSERGELSSSQDSDEWAAFVLARREEYAEPNIVRPFVDKCMEYKILPYVEDYEVQWSDLFAISDAQQVDIGVKRSTALMQYCNNSIAQQIVSPDAFLEYFGGFSQEDIELINAMQTDEILSEPEVTPEETELLTQGGQGSGNFDHEGRPGEVGGSGDGGGMTYKVDEHGINFKSDTHQFYLNMRESVDATIKKGTDKMNKLMKSVKKDNTDYTDYLSSAPLSSMELISKVNAKLTKSYQAGNQMSMYLNFANGAKVRVSNHRGGLATELDRILFRYDQATNADYITELSRVVNLVNAKD